MTSKPTTKVQEGQPTLQTIQVAMATYNGERFIEQQIDSLLSQTMPIEFIVHDDGSIDQTPEIVSRMLPEHRTHVLNEGASGGASANFAYILANTSAKYVFCCDQDDIWRDDKVHLLYETMSRLEQIHGADVPMLIHTDLKLIDQDGEKLSDSYHRYQNLDPSWAEVFPKLLTQNVVVGCSVMVNRALLEKALPVPPEAVMHDWWLALVACAFGKVFYIPECTVEYRRHTTNAVGARKFNFGYVMKSVMTVISRHSNLKTWYYSNAKQAAVFAQRFDGSAAAHIAKVFASLPETPWHRRLYLKVRYNFRKVGTIRNLAWFAL